MPTTLFYEIFLPLLRLSAGGKDRNPAALRGPKLATSGSPPMGKRNSSQANQSPGW